MADDEAQRDLEKKALRNVRGLVDKIEAEDAKGSQKQLIAAAVIAAAVAIVAVLWMVSMSKNKSADSKAKPALEIPPPKIPGK
jgi:hypothetical protein